MAQIPRCNSCATVITSTRATLTDEIDIETASNGAGALIGAQLFGLHVIANDAIAHKSDVLPVDLDVAPDAVGFTQHLHTADLNLCKLDTHRVTKKSKRVEWIGTFTLDDMIYTPDLCRDHFFTNRH